MDARLATRIGLSVPLGKGQVSQRTLHQLLYYSIVGRVRLFAPDSPNGMSGNNEAVAQPTRLVETSRLPAETVPPPVETFRLPVETSTLL